MAQPSRSPKPEPLADRTVPLSVFDIEKEGWLQKQSRHLGKFRHRWMVLEGNYLYSFKREKDYTDPTEIINLAHYLQAQIDPAQPLRFSLRRRDDADERIVDSPLAPSAVIQSTDSADFIFFSTSLNEVQEWVHAINRIVFLLSPINDVQSPFFDTRSTSQEISSPTSSVAVTLTSTSSGAGLSEVLSSTVEYSHTSMSGSLTRPLSPPLDEEDGGRGRAHGVDAMGLRRRRVNPMQAIAERRDQIIEKMNRVSSIRELENIREEFVQIHRDIHRLTIEKTNKEDEVENLRTRVRDLKISFGLENADKVDRNSIEYLRKKKHDLDAKAKALWDEYLKVRAESDALHERIAALRKEQRQKGSQVSIGSSASHSSMGGSASSAETPNVVLTAKMASKLSTVETQLEDVEIEFSTLVRLLSESNLSNPDRICENLQKLFNDKRHVLISNVRLNPTALRGWRALDLAAYLCVCDSKQFGRHRAQIGNLDDSSNGWIYRINEHTLMNLGISNVHEIHAILKCITELTNSASL